MRIAGEIIAVCWVTFWGAWIIGAVTARRATTTRSRSWAMWLVRFAVVAAIVLLRWRSVRVERLVWWSSSVALAVSATAITAAGLLLALWARVVLGSLWSSEVAIKQQHAVIDHGPYAFVRHPIYAAMLLMLFGTAL